MKNISKLLVAGVAVLGLGLSTLPMEAQARTHVVKRVVVVRNVYTTYHTCGYACGCRPCCCGRSYLLWPLF